MFPNEPLVEPTDRLNRLALVLSALFLFTVTWDRLLTLDAFGFTFRITHLFAIALFGVVAASLREQFIPRMRALSKNYFLLSFLAVATYYALTSPWSFFPLKSFAYCSWLFFDIAVVWTCLVHVWSRIPESQIFKLVAAVICFHAIIIVIDGIAFHFGFDGGLVGYNQEISLRWGVSRPTAFSYEPSYIATFLSMGLIFIFPSLLKRLEYAKTVVAILTLLILAVLMTTSRTGWFSMAMGCLGVSILSYRPQRSLERRQIVLIAASILLAIVLHVGLFALKSDHEKVIFKQNLVGFMSTGQDGSGHARVEAIISSGTMAKETNWLGTGLGASYAYWVAKHLEQVEPPDTSSVIAGKKDFGKEAVMSTWGQLMAEGGPIATLLYGLSAIFLVWRLWSRWRLMGGPLQLGALSASVVFFSFNALLIGNIARLDVWVWYALWGVAGGYGTTKAT